MQSQMKYSIRKQFTLVFSLLMAGTILLCWFINNTFLEDFYLKNKQNAMLSAYTIINKASNEGKIDSDAFDIEFEMICGRNNINIIILDAETRTLKTSMNDYEILSRQLLDYLFSPSTLADGRILYKEDKYEMNIIRDARTQQEYVDMWGVLDNGNLFLFRSPLESIRQSVAVANRFLAYVGMGSVLVSALVIWLVSRKVTEPIMELTQISERMIHLDFDAKYTGNSKTEVALLGKISMSYQRPWKIRFRN